MQKRLFILIAVLAAMAATAFMRQPASAQTIGGLSRPPHDSADAERVRIWFPRESSGKCRVTLEIVDDSGTVVRHMANFLASPGYYNIYWDKRDDSGRRVPAGTYRYILDNCGEQDSRPIVAKYTQWEKKIDFSPYDPANPGEVLLKVAADSVPVSITVHTQSGRLLRTVFEDSLFNEGEVPVRIDPDSIGLRFGNYQIWISAGDYTYIREVTFLP